VDSEVTGEVLMCARVTILASSENRSNDLEGTGACFTRKIFKNDKKQEREREIH